MLRAAVTLQEFAAGRTPLRSQPCKQALPVPCPLLQPGRCHPQRFTAPPALTKLRPKASCVPAAPALRGHQGFVGSAVGAPAGAWWPPTWSDFAWERCGVAAHPLAMCSAWQTSCWWPRGSCSTPFSPLPLLLEGFSRKPSPGNHVVIRCAPKRAFCSMVAWLSACGARVHAEMLLRGFGASSASCHRCGSSPAANCNAGERCRARGLLHPERPAGECCWVRKGQTRPLPARPCREVGRSRAGCRRPVTRLSVPAGWRSLASTTPTSGRLLPPCPAR